MTVDLYEDRLHADLAGEGSRHSRDQRRSHPRHQFAARGLPVRDGYASRDPQRSVGRRFLDANHLRFSVFEIRKGDRGLLRAEVRCTSVTLDQEIDPRITNASKIGSCSRPGIFRTGTVRGH